MKKTIYVFSDGDFKRKDNTLFFKNEEGKRFIPVEDTKEIMVFGQVNLNKRFLEFIGQKEIILHFFNYYGYYSGSYYPREHFNSGYMTLKQSEIYLKKENRLQLAKLFVKGAIKNISQVITYYKNRGKDVNAQINSISKILNKIDSCSDTLDLMALEGNVREIYYKSFDEIIDNKTFKFEKRSKRPPKNHLNCLISFGNTIIYTMILSEIYKTHLDPRIGFLHTTNFRRFTLNLDVSEIFKPILIDRLIFRLISKKMISEKDFERRLGGILLKEKGKKTFISELDKRLETTINHRAIGRKVSYRRLLRLELYKIQKHILEEKEYTPFIARW